MQLAEERSLVQRAVRGDADALSALLEEYGPGVRTELSIDAKWSTVLEVEDVMQVTYLDAFLRVARFNSPGSGPTGFRAWLRQIAQNNLRDAVKELSRQKRPQPGQRVAPRPLDESVSAFITMLGVTLTTPSQLASGNEHVGLMQRALDALPPDYATAVRMYDLEGIAIEEVARRLGRSPGAVHMLRSRAHDMLRETLGGASQFFSSGGV
ncbi:MAG: RNA polymerase sigma factor [Phycisphaerae bacterium]